MLDHTDPVASIIPAQSHDAPSDNAMTALYRLALGPVNTDYYLAVFERFDSTGRTTTTWNWAACLATLNWMVFRQLWSPALVYLAAAEGLALALYAMGRSLLQWPLGVELGVMGAFAMLAFAVPGLYGNALLYADIRKRVGRALAASRTLPETCAVLQKQASSRKRLQLLVLANVGLVAAAALVYLAWPASSSSPTPSDAPPAASQPTTPSTSRPLPLGLEPEVTVAQAASAAASASVRAASGPAPAASTPTPDATPTSGPVAALEAHDSAPSAAALATRAAAPASAPGRLPATAVPAQTPLASSAQAAAAPTRAAQPQPEPAAQERKAPDSAAVSAAPARPATSAPAPASKRASQAGPTATTKAAKAAKAPASVASAAGPAALAPVGSAAGYYINVGLFADEANARKAQARLLNEGLPAFRQEIESPKGRRIRVRVGPYDSRARADAAAATIRAMSLEAVVFKK